MNAQIGFFETGDETQLAPFYNPPLAVYFRDQVEVFSEMSQFWEFAHKRRKAYQKAGVERLALTISAMELVRNMQFRLWVRWNYHFIDMVPRNGSEVIYYCRETADGLQVQLVQTSQSFVKDFGEEALPLALSRPVAG